MGKSKKDLVGRYEIGKEANLGPVNPKYSFLARMYSSRTDLVMAELEDKSLGSLAKTVSAEFPWTQSVEESEVKSFPDRIIKNNKGRFPVSENELIDFYEMLKGLSS
jgi:hypothetical protein